MKLFLLDNEYTDYIVMAESEDEAWEKLGRHEILRPDAQESEEGQPAYHPIVEVKDGLGISNPNDLKFVM